MAMRRVLPVMLAAVHLAGLGCSKPRVGGDPREITVVAEDRTWAAAESTLIRGLARKVMLLDEESVFWVHRLGIEALQTIRRRPMVLFLASVDDRGPVTELVSTISGKTPAVLASSAPLTRLTDPWAHGQVAYVLSGATTSQVDSLAQRTTPMLYDDFFMRYRATVRERLYARGEDAKRAKDLTARFGWSLLVPRPWDMEEDADQRWVHFVKTEPDRHVSVYWEDWAESTVTPEYCLRARRTLAWTKYDEDEVDDSRTSYSWGSFLGRRAVEITGAWINRKYTAGGPFRTICFLVEEQRRLYLVDLVTFAPDRPKFYVMTQLGIIAETFTVAGHGARGQESSQHGTEAL
jgi:hypothetical protein